MKKRKRVKGVRKNNNMRRDSNTKCQLTFRFL
jgi:hypothetical protein